ncbi:MAG: VanZ family protein [Bacteroidales bacterium]|nr:VanZ family protein [Bacteroidales bacterium]
MKIIKYWKPIVIALVIFYGSVTSGSNLNKVNIFQINNIDKFIHFSFYFLLSVSFQSSLLRNTLINRKDHIIITLVIVISYGLIMEVFQFYFTNDRSAELFDVMANTVGCIFGILIFSFLQKHDFIKYL